MSIIFILTAWEVRHRHCKTHCRPDHCQECSLDTIQQSTSQLVARFEQNIVQTGTGSEEHQFVGAWSGTLSVMGIKLRIVFNIVETDIGLTATMDSPDQGAFGIMVDGLVIQDNTIRMQVKSAGITYQGDLLAKEIKGTFAQGSQVYPLDLQSTQIQAGIPDRPQEPQPPFPYHTENIYFVNPIAGIRLAGTLTLPKSDNAVPVAVLISGSGPQDRNEEIMGHKPFLVIADHLTRQGIAVLRFDDRGVGESEGKFSGSTTADFATDVTAAVSYLRGRKEIDHSKIGLIGHSEGGIIAPIIAADDEGIAFIVLLAGTGIPGDQIILMQQELIGRASGISEEEINHTRQINQKSFEIIRSTDDPEARETMLRDYLLELIHSGEMDIPDQMSPEELLELQTRQIINPWMLHFLTYDPAPVLERVTCPVLALIGDKDLQVPSEINLQAIRKALEKGGSQYITTIELPGLNHLFQHCDTGSPLKYGVLTETFAVHVLELMADWIRDHTK